MSLETATSERLVFARRWEVVARYAMFGAMACILLAGILQQFWLALVAVIVGMPFAWIINLQCPVCSWPVYRAYGTAKAKHAKDKFFAPLYSKILYKQPENCTKCQRAFWAKADPIGADG